MKAMGADKDLFALGIADALGFAKPVASTAPMSQAFAQAGDEAIRLIESIYATRRKIAETCDIPTGA